ncbi:pyridoxal-phosphate dependent enzyme [Halobaculum sp. MBLA0147]|uniref:pyridoxal-phosphate dependent enzyme n=1 Tax=Halobaculum sp. MBLA0147 TaxID=3079934 RepID=UPI003523F2D0
MTTTRDGFRGFRCSDCGATFDPDTHGRCPDCDGLLTARYDDDPERVRAGLADPADAPLPFACADRLSASEGGTPLLRTDRLAEESGVGDVFLKDEGRNPTGTVYDRGMATAVTAAATTDVEPLALAAAGNAGQSAAAYAGRADLRSYAFVPSRTAFSNKAMVNVHGGEMRVVGGRFDDAAAAVDDQLAADYYSLSAFETPYRVAGTKTLGYELCADYAVATDALPARTPEAVADAAPLPTPDAVVVPVGTGEVLVAVERALAELSEAALLASVPAVYAVQPAGCAPIASAAAAGEDTTEPWDRPDTIVGELEIPDPVGGDHALAALSRLEGGAVTVSDDDALESAVTAAQTEVVEVGGAGGVALAGAWALADDGTLGDTDDVVVVNPDAGVKTPDVLRSHLMGQGI